VGRRAKTILQPESRSTVTIGRKLLIVIGVSNTSA
jgi:hypothetical protein